MKEYNWTKNTDGTYTIFGVPIFQEVIDTRYGKNVRYNKKWLEEAVRNQNALERASHFPAVHYGHNTGEEREKLGEMFNFRLGNMDVKQTVFVDIRDIPKHVFDKMFKGKLPHRSVEITSPESHRFGSLALLSSRAPFFPLPNLKLARNEMKQTSSFYASEVCINNFFMEGNMPEDKKKDNFPETTEEEKKPQEMQGEDMTSKLDEIMKRLEALEQKVEAMGGKSKDESESPIAESGNESEQTPMSAAIESRLASMESVMFSMQGETSEKVNKYMDYALKSEAEKNIQAAVSLAEKRNKVFDPDKFASDCRYYMENCNPETAQKMINDLLDAMPIATGMGREYAVGAEEAELSGYLENYNDPKEREIAQEAGYYALANGYDPETWIRGEVRKFQYTNGKKG